jgi:DNA-directed RNA polymerase specialized sigma24 family protein
MDELVDRYGRLITWAIKLTADSKSVRLSPEDVEDAYQHVLVRVWEQDFLTRCRAYYATHEGRFSTSLKTLTVRATLNFLRPVEKERRRFESLDDAGMVGVTHSGEDALIARAVLARLEQCLSQQPSGDQLVRVLRVCLLHETTSCLRALTAELQASESTVQRRLRMVKRELALLAS